MGDQLLVSLLPVQDNFTITMNSKLSLILFGILVVAALAAAMTEDEEMELSEEIAAARVERDAGDRRRRKNGGNKRPRKQRGRKARKGKGKKRNNRPNRGPDGRRKGGRQSTSTSANSTCFENAVFYMKLWKDVVGNFEKQNKRMTKQNSTGQSKSGKKGTFAPIAFKLVDIGGGNKTNMSCGGSYNNSGAMQLQNLTKTLFDCELSVNASCNPANFPQPNTTFITMCENLTSSFKTAVQACLNKTIGGTKTNVSDACGCWVGPQLNQTEQSIKSCKASDSAKAISKQLSKCQKAFSVCRKYEDDAIPAIMACAQDSTKLTAKAKTLAAANAKMSSLSSSNSSSGRRVRATATSCAEILTKAAALSTKVSQKPTADISAEAKEISDVPSTVTCTDAEKTSMKTQVTSMESAISSVSKALSSVQTLLSTLTGTTIASSSLVTSASTSTAASSGRRERLVRDLMRNKF